MQTYQPYYPTQTTYPAFNSQFPMQNPYMDRLNQLQQYQQNLQMSAPQQPQPQVQQMPMGINGKIVLSMENITANDVPMDGSIAFFPKQDMTEIYAKSWNADGTIKTVIYKPFIDSPNNISQSEEKAQIGLSNEVTEAFMKRFDDIEKRLDDFKLSFNKTPNKNTNFKPKKETAVNE